MAVETMEIHMQQPLVLPHLTSAYQQGRKLLSARSEHVIGALHCAIVELMSKPPSFKEVARDLLAQRLEAINQISNPDLFVVSWVNERSGALESMSLTDVFILAICQGTEVFRYPGLRIDFRSSTWGNRPVPVFALQQFKDHCEYLIPKVWPTYESSIDGHWNAQVTVEGVVADQPAWSGTRRRLLDRIMSLLELQELVTAVSAGVLGEDEAVLCRHVIGSTSDPEMICSVGINLPDIGDQLFIGGYVIAHNVDLNSETGGPLYLFEVTRGWRKFDSVAALKRDIFERLSEDEHREALCTSLSRKAADHLEEYQADLSRIGVFIRPASLGLPQQLFQSVCAKQWDDTAYEVAAVTESKDSIDLFLNELSEVFAMSDLQEGFLYRLSQLLAINSEESEPQWLREADADSKRMYAERADSAYKADEYVAELLDAVGDRDVYASAAIRDYLQTAMGYSVGPASVAVKIVESLSLNKGPIKIEHSCSLLELVIEGMPSLESDAIIEVSLPRGYEHPEFNGAFIQRMVKDLNIAHLYAEALVSRHREPVFRHALAEVYAKGFALSALAAKLQKHIDETTYHLLETLQTASSLAPNVVIGRLYLKQSLQAFGDAYVIQITGQDSRYVLFAPGAPERDVHEFESWSQLSTHVFGWLEKPGGTAYIHEQTVIKTGDSSGRYLEQLLLKPNDWREDYLIFTAMPARTLKDALSSVADNKVNRMLHRNDVVSVSRLASAQPGFAQRLITLDFRIRGLKKELDGRSGVRPYADVAHLECQKLISTHLQMSEEAIDPDTVLFDLRQNPDPSTPPEFGPYSPLVSLTELYMEGYSLEDYRFRSDALMYSTVGQDLSGLTPEFIDNMIRTSTLPDRYLKTVSGEMDMSVHVNKVRCSISTRLLQYEMQRNATRELMLSRISPKQYDLVMSLRDSATQGKKGLRLVPLSIIEDVHVFGNYLVYIEGNDDLALRVAYTPQAPDGVVFRPAHDVIKSLRLPGMSHYIYARTQSGKLGAMNRVLKHIQTLDPSKSTPYEVRREAVAFTTPTDWRRSYTNQLKHIYADVARLTETRTERAILGWYLFARNKGKRVVKVMPKNVQLFWHLFHGGIDLMRAAYAHDAGNRDKRQRLFISAAKEGYAFVKTARKINKQKKKDFGLKQRGQNRRLPERPALQAGAGNV